MTFFYGLAIAVIGVVLFFYPVARLIDVLLFGDLKAEREREWRFLLANLCLTEYQMLEEINETRQQMGMDKIPFKPVAVHFNNRWWNSLTMKVRNIVRGGVNEIFWRNKP